MPALLLNSVLMKNSLFPLSLIVTLVGVAQPISAQTFPSGIEIVAELSHALNQGNDVSQPPYYVLRFPSVDAGIVGR